VWFFGQVDAVDPKSRHKGKLDTETLLQSKGVPWTSIRPVYIYGPLNYNPVEEWFFQRLKEGRPIPVPGSGMQITQLGHVKVGVSTSLIPTVLQQN
jgi:nucleoside-diphosphate-sugar epimerase